LEATTVNYLLVGRTAGISPGFVIKAMGAYDLTGKTTGQIDAFRQTFIDTL
jgi:hypothetical protein